MKITQHKSVNSLKTYGRLSDRKRKAMSGILNDGLVGNDVGQNELSPLAKAPKYRAQPKSPARTKSNELGTSNTIKTPDLDDIEIENYMANFDFSNRSPPRNIMSTNQRHTNFQPVFHGCTVTINYHQH